MHLLKQEVQQYLKLTHTQQNSNNTQKDSHFVPFLKERDSMGRLIRNQFSSLKLVETQQTEERSPSKLLQKQRKSQEKMQKYFKNSASPNLNLPFKQKMHKKTAIELISQRPLSKNEKKTKFSARNTKQLLLLRPFTQSANIFQSQELFMPSNQKKENFLIKRSQSTMLPSRKSNNKSKKRQISPSSIPRRSSYYQSKIKIEQNEDNYPELIRLRKMKQLQVKLHGDFQQKHGQFMDKLIKSKQLAFEVKIQLDKIDDLCLKGM